MNLPFHCFVTVLLYVTIISSCITSPTSQESSRSTVSENALPDFSFIKDPILRDSLKLFLVQACVIKDTSQLNIISLFCEPGDSIVTVDLSHEIPEYDSPFHNIGAAISNSSISTIVFYETSTLIEQDSLSRIKAYELLGKNYYLHTLYHLEASYFARVYEKKENNWIRIAEKNVGN